MKPSVETTNVLKFRGAGVDPVPDLLAVEEPLEIRLGFGPEGQREQTRVAVTMRTPGHDFELTAGFLFTEGIISSIEQIETIHYCSDLNSQEEKGNVLRVELKPGIPFFPESIQRNFYTTSSCGVCGKSSIESVRTSCRPVSGDFVVEKDIIHQLPEKMRSSQLVFEFTGGLHSVSLFEPTGDEIISREDIGRHNAFDKVVGAMVSAHRIPLSGTIAFVSGRASFELIQKAVMAGIPVIAAVGAPSSLAVSLASEFGCTLLGFVRKDRFNVYSGSHRIHFQ